MENGLKMRELVGQCKKCRNNVDNNFLAEFYVIELNTTEKILECFVGKVPTSNCCKQGHDLKNLAQNNWCRNNIDSEEIGKIKVANSNHCRNDSDKKVC